MGRLHALIWVLIYAGLLTLVLGIATARTDAAWGWGLQVAGTVAALFGVALMAVRARMPADVP